ncbi:CRISPR-associated helicase/endonuclease Cas3 [Spirosoma daeguense]
MNSLDTILAKSKSYGGTTLLDHTRHVAEAINVFAREWGGTWGFDSQLAWKAAALHDLGKAHPKFQQQIAEANAKTLRSAMQDDYAHRHELSSLGFLPIFPKEEWNALIDMVVAHHKPIENDKRGRGIVDLDENDRYFIKNHLKDWDNWSPYGLAILEKFGIVTRPISQSEAREALEYAVEYCRNLEGGWSPLRGLLQSADHFASAFVDKTSHQLTGLFRPPNISFYHNPDRKSWLYPLSETSVEDPRPHTLVVAPTGAGKTDFLVRRCVGRFFYTLPYQASINAMYDRMKNTVPDADIRVMHATSKILVKGDEEAQTLQPFAGASVKVLTPHQIASIIFGTAGFESVMLDLQGCDVILDEIHTYTDISRAMVLEIVKTLVRLNCRIHVGTATMPTILYNEILRLLGGPEQVYEVTLPDDVLDTFDRHIVHKVKDVEQIESILEKAFEQGDKVLLIYNTIKKAQEAYKWCQERFADIPKMLIHSRFRRGDRIKLEKQLKEEFNGDDPQFQGGQKPCLVVSTQVVEVSLDISFDRMITEAAPLDALIQRFGRINRKRNEQTIGTYKPVHVLKPEGKCLPYNKAIVEASYEQLPDQEILSEQTLQKRIDLVYTTIDTREIDIHLIQVEEEFLLKTLCNRPKSVLIDALEIEAATCILEEDKARYETAYWEERIGLEIPISWRVIAPHYKQYEQLEIGSYPFVVPQNLVAYQTYGLQLVEPDNFL